MKDIKEITERLEKGVKDIFDSGRFYEYLSFMGRFHAYSVSNTILIWLQMPKASYVAGYRAWQEKFKRQVRKGEKAITILAPCPHKFVKEVTNEDGEKEQVEVTYKNFRPVSVFDISQTDGEDVPELAVRLTGDVEDYEPLLAKLEGLSPVPVSFEETNDGSNGYYRLDEKRIVVKSGMSQRQTIKTLVHEISHAILHDKDTGTEKDAGKNLREVQAESVAYTVCSALGLDTSDYSFGYVAGWSGEKEVKELLASMQVIRDTASFILGKMEEAV